MTEETAIGTKVARFKFNEDQDSFLTNADASKPREEIVAAFVKLWPCPSELTERAYAEKIREGFRKRLRRPRPAQNLSEAPTRGIQGAQECDGAFLTRIVSSSVAEATKEAESIADFKTAPDGVSPSASTLPRGFDPWIAPTEPPPAPARQAESSRPTETLIGLGSPGLPFVHDRGIKSDVARSVDALADRVGELGAAICARSVADADLIASLQLTIETQKAYIAHLQRLVGAA